MCTFSAIAQDWIGRNPNYQQWALSPVYAGPTVEEFNALRAEIEALKKLLAAAKTYDAETGQRDCEDAEKVALLKKLAVMVGVDLNKILENGATHRQEPR